MRQVRWIWLLGLILGFQRAAISSSLEDFLKKIPIPIPEVAVPGEDVEIPPEILAGALILDDNLAEKIISVLGSSEVERKGICTEPRLNTRASNIFRRVVTHAQRKDVRYAIKVLNDYTVNAYAVPGGHVYVNRGLLEIPGLSDDEIAAVLGHEVTHVEKRHGLKQLKQRLLIGWVLGKLSEESKAGALLELAGQLYTSGRSRKDEREADLLGARLSQQAGYRVAGAITFMRRLEVMARDERSRHPGGSSLMAMLEQRLRSHPPTQTRSEYLKDYLFVWKYGSDFRLSSAAVSSQRGAMSATGSRDRILLTTGPHHIGDDRAGIDTIWSGSFNLTEADLAGRESASVVFLLRSVEVRRDPNVYFNRVKVGFAVTRSRNWERFEFEVLLNVLHPGRNLIDIETVIPDLWQSYDDCEFKNVYLVFRGRGLGPPSEEAGQWLSGIIHCHSTFSDGSRNPEQCVLQARAAGARFLIVTDHYEQIDGDRKPGGKKKVGARFADDQGFANYRSRFSSLSGRDFVVIPGAEITTFWQGSASHLLAVGDLAYRDNVLLDLQMKEGTQQDTIKRVVERGLLAVAAHPHLISTMYQQWYGEISNLQFDPAAAKGIHGLEFFNDETSEGYAGTLRWYLSLVGRGDDVFVTSGCDAHIPQLDLLDLQRWTRKTWIYTDNVSEGSVLTSLRAGRSYAANGNARFAGISPIPGFDPRRVSRAVVGCTVVFPGPTLEKKKIRVYRDGKLLAGSEKEVPRATVTYRYICQDKTARGLHRYVVEVDNALVSSPIVLDVSPAT
jgi:Zn-dependent protease with chaperone function/histidinol phosphatase-like PHP family hydrolase